MVVFDVHSISGDDVNGFLQVIWVAGTFDLSNNFCVAQVFVKAIDEAA